MPDTFDPDHLRASLKPLAEWQPLSDEAKAYQRFYKTDFAERDVWRGMGRFEVDGYELVSHCWWPEKVKATLFLLHGYYDHIGLYRHVIEWALDQDFAVIACDLPGHGLSSGPRASIRDFAEYQHMLQALFAEATSIALPQPWHLCGQSTGGRDCRRSLAQPWREQPGAGPGDSAGAAGATTGLGLVAVELLPAAAICSRRRAALQRKFQRSGLSAVSAGRSVTAKTSANEMGGRVVALDHPRRAREKKSATAADHSGTGGHDRRLAAQSAGVEMEVRPPADSAVGRGAASPGQ
ncbi:pimeloyl-ACP methyl ester carboxylesterase [Pseudomonas fluorescens]|nr:pimeloyl-ACP methyl ester carboxylesterase [Pseudomonas fluorescens]